LQAQQVRRQLKHEFTKAFEEVDIMMMPTLPVLPNDIGDDWADLNGKKVDLIDNIIRFTGPGNLTGLPGLSVPCGFSKGLPVGLAVMGLGFGEAERKNAGYAFEKTSPMGRNKAALLEYMFKIARRDVMCCAVLFFPLQFFKKRDKA